MVEPALVHGIAFWWRHLPARVVPRGVGLPIGESWPVPVLRGKRSIHPVFVWWLTGMAPHA